MLARSLPGSFRSEPRANPRPARSCARPSAPLAQSNALSRLDAQHEQVVHRGERDVQAIRGEGDGLDGAAAGIQALDEAQAWPVCWHIGGAAQTPAMHDDPEQQPAEAEQL